MADTFSPAATVRAFWQRRAPRERMFLALAVTVAALGALWGALLAPPLATLRQAEQDRADLAAQAQQMQRLARQADALKALPQINAADALRALQTTTEQRLGEAAKLTAQGDRASVTLTRVSATQLANWLADARANARATVQEMRLTRDAATATTTGESGNPTPPAASIAAPAPPVWSGTLLLALPPS